MRRTVGIMLAAFVVSSVVAARGEPAKKPSEGKASPVLSTNIRLDFKMVPLDDDDDGVFIITAGPEYETATYWKDEGNEIFFEVSGTIARREDGRYLVNYAAHVKFDGRGGKARFSASASILMEAGKETGVAQLGEKTLVISVTPLKP